MKRWIAAVLALAAVLGVTGCVFPSPEEPALPTPAPAENAAEPTPAPDVPETAEPAESTEIPETSQESAAETYGHAIEAFFPEDWAGRYVLEYDESSVALYCRAAWDEADGQGWLCSFVHMTNPDYMPPAYVELGTWEGYPVWKVERSDVPGYESQEIFDEWIDMMRDTVEIGEAVRAVLSAQAGEDSVDALYVTPERYVEYGYYTGVFRLICDDWTDASVEALLDPAYPYGFLSIAGDGAAYFMQGRNLMQGTVVMYHDDSAKPEDMPLYRFTFDGVTYGADMLQTMIVMENMPEYTYLAGDAEHRSTVWTFLHEENDWWTEETFAGDVG